MSRLVHRATRRQSRIDTEPHFLDKFNPQLARPNKTSIDEKLNPVAMQTKLAMAQIENSPWRFMFWPFTELNVASRPQGNLSWWYIKVRLLPHMMNPPTRKDTLRLYRHLIKASTQVQDRVISDAAIAQVRRDFRKRRNLRFLHRICKEYALGQSALTQLRFYGEYLEIDKHGEIDCQVFEDPRTKFAMPTLATYGLVFGLTLFFVVLMAARKYWETLQMRSSGLTREERMYLQAQDNLRTAAAVGDETMGMLAPNVVRKLAAGTEYYKRDIEDLEQETLRVLKLDIARMIAQYEATHTDADKAASLHPSRADGVVSLPPEIAVWPGREAPTGGASARIDVHAPPVENLAVPVKAAPVPWYKRIFGGAAEQEPTLHLTAQRPPTPSRISSMAVARRSEPYDPAGTNAIPGMPPVFTTSKYGDNIAQPSTSAPAQLLRDAPSLAELAAREMKVNLPTR